MRITDVRYIAVPLTGHLSNATVNFGSHTVSLVALVTDEIRDGRPLYGAAFNSIGRFDQNGILSRRIAPRLLDAAPENLLSHTEEGAFDPEAIRRVAMTDEKQGGHGDRAGAIAAVELAAWDLNAKLADEPAFATIARAFDRPVPIDPAVSTYAAGGYYISGASPAENVAALRSEIEHHRAAGFRSVKIKIGGAPLEVDLTRAESAIEAAGAPERVAVDVNCGLAAGEAIHWAETLAPYGLRWLEEPTDPLDFAELSRAVEAFGGPIATGENLFSRQDVINLLRYSGLRSMKDIFQMDPGLSYGVTEYAAMVAAIEDAGMSRWQAIPHGGHLLNLHIVAGLGLGGCESYPNVFEPVGGYGPDISPVDGCLYPSEAPGFGLETKPEIATYLDRLLAY